jgi:glycosyltransferase involved in cell wall biosynthesis
LISAYKLYVESCPDAIRLKIVSGKGWGDVSISRILEDSDLLEYVDKIEKLDESELGLLYRNAYALVMPSFYEGFGLPVVEAISQGIPVITTKKSAMEEVAGAAAIVIDPNNIGEIALAMANITADKGLYAELCSNAEERAFIYSWDRSSEQLLELLESLDRY